MAAPEIDSPLLWEVAIGVTVSYRIHALNHPTEFGATGLPSNLSINAPLSPRIQGKVHVAGTYTVPIEATNDDGTDTADLVIIATDEGGGGGGGEGDPGIITVYPAKTWSEEKELLDFADIDAAGQPLAIINVDSIGTDQLSVDAIANKMALLGGPGRIFQYEFPEALTFAGARITHFLQSISIPGVKPGDFVVMGELLDSDGVYLGLDSAALRTAFFFGRSSPETVGIYFWCAVSGTIIPARSRINFRTFSYPT